MRRPQAGNAKCSDFTKVLTSEQPDGEPHYQPRLKLLYSIIPTYMKNVFYFTLLLVLTTVGVQAQTLEELKTQKADLMAKQGEKQAEAASTDLPTTLRKSPSVGIP